MFLKCQLWQSTHPHTPHIRFPQNVCFIYCFVYYLSRRQILWAGSSVHLAETKPCVAVQSLAVFHSECTAGCPTWERMWDLPTVGSPHQAEGALPVPCNPKPTHAFQTQMFLGWVTMKTAKHQVHLATFTLLRTTEPNMVLQGCITEMKDSPAILGMSRMPIVLLGVWDFL